MQEAFEKIIDQLEILQKDKYVMSPIMCYAFGKAIEIVKQVAAEYSECNKNCTECEAYNKKKHYCPKFCHVIQETVKEIEEAKALKPKGE